MAVTQGGGGFATEGEARALLADSSAPKTEPFRDRDDRGAGEEVDHTDDLPPVCFCQVTKVHARVYSFLIVRACV
jgi:hypothetical protein